MELKKPPKNPTFLFFARRWIGRNRNDGSIFQVYEDGSCLTVLVCDNRSFFSYIMNDNMGQKKNPILLCVSKKMQIKIMICQPSQCHCGAVR